jgi:D-psicose/D-tagatose/L-ribulose 3-epimerase
MNNKLGIHYGCFVSEWMEDQLPLVKKAKNLGFDMLEFGAFFLASRSDDQIKRFKDEAEKEGIELTLSLGLNIQQDVGSPKEEYRRAGLKVLTDTAVAMRKAGISDCSGIIYSAWNGKVSTADERKEYWVRSVRTMKEASKVFEDQGVYFNLEVVNRFESFLINDCAVALQYLDEVGTKNMGIHLDTFHMNIEENSMVSAIVKAKDRLRYFHIGENNRKFPGLGTMPWKMVFDALRAIDYTRPITMESFVRIGNEVAAAVSLFRPLMDTSDYENDIRSSVTFVRNLMKD